MLSQRIQPLPWAGGPLSYAACLEQKVERLFCFYSGLQGRFSYVGFRPKIQIEIYPGSQKVSQAGKVEEFCRNPFELLKEYTSYTPTTSSPYFQKGWLGFFSYEMAHFADSSLKTKEVSPNTLLGSWSYYDSVLIFDHQEKQAYLSFLEDSSAQEIQGLIKSFSDSSFLPDKIFKTSHARQNFESYQLALQKILDYLKAGDCYQVNYTQSFEVELFPDLSPFTCFRSLAQKHPAPFSAFLDYGTKQILSFSPEEYLNLSGRKIRTRPIKGSRARADDPLLNQKNIQELLNSSKDESELLMIVDLLRNDLGRSCEYGSVKTSSLGELESYDYVHHRVATLEGVLKSNLHPFDLVKSLFPGGSITGAPKKRAMEIISDLEFFPRGVYTGIIGFMSENLAQFNIAIRTLELYGERGIFGVGGGIVVESDPQKEYEECLVKAKVFG